MFFANSTVTTGIVQQAIVAPVAAAGVVVAAATKPNYMSTTQSMYRSKKRGGGGGGNNNLRSAEVVPAGEVIMKKPKAMKTVRRTLLVIDNDEFEEGTEISANGDQLLRALSLENRATEIIFEYSDEDDIVEQKADVKSAIIKIHPFLKVVPFTFMYVVRINGKVLEF